MDSLRGPPEHWVVAVVAGRPLTLARRSCRVRMQVTAGGAGVREEAGGVGQVAEPVRLPGGAGKVFEAHY